MRNLFICLILTVLASPVFATQEVFIQAGFDGAAVDTLYVDYAHQFRILIENDFKLAGMSLPFVIYSDNGVTWEWVSQPDGLPQDGLQAVTEIVGSRAVGAWDMTGFRADEYDMDGNSPDTIMIGGVALMAGLPSGPMEHMYSLHIRPTAISGDINVICIDSTFIPPSSVFIFADLSSGVRPTFNGPFCWPVVSHTYIIGDFDFDGIITVGDAVELVKFVFLGKPRMGPIEAGDANCDGATNVGDILYLINHVFRSGPAPGCE